MGHDVRQLQMTNQEANPDADAEPERSANDHERGRLGKELIADIARGRTQRLTYANLPGALGDADQHDVHYADATERQRHQSNRAEEDGHDVENSLHQLRTVERIPDEEGVCVGGIEVALASENLIDLTHRLFVLFRISDFDHQVVDESLRDAGPIGWGKIAGHGSVGNEQLSIVGAAPVTAILFFLLQHTDDGIGRAQHGQEAAQFVRSHGRGGLPQDLPDVQELRTSRLLDVPDRLT